MELNALTVIRSFDQETLDYRGKGMNNLDAIYVDADDFCLLFEPQ